MNSEVLMQITLYFTNIVLAVVSGVLFVKMAYQICLIGNRADMYKPMKVVLIGAEALAIILNLYKIVAVLL